MAILLVDYTGFAGGASGGTTSAIDTTGANLIVVAVAGYTGTSASTMSDSKGNGWTGLTTYAVSGGALAAVRIFYSTPTTVGTGHTFTLSGSNLYSSLFVLAFSGAAASSPLDQATGGTATGSFGLTVTPTADSEVLITATADDTAGTFRTIAGFTITNQIAYSGSYGGAAAYLIQTTAASNTSTWTGISEASARAAAIATFKPAGAGPTPKTFTATDSLAGGELL